jgi:hypothetical protein
MTQSDPILAARDTANSDVSVPAGTPGWISTELVKHTIAVWQPRFQAQLSVRDAVELLLTVGRLFGALREGVAHDKAICSAGTRLVT